MVCRHVLYGYSRRLGRNALIQRINIKKYWTIFVIYNAYLGNTNRGFTHTDFKKRRSVVGIGITNTKQQFINTIVHEAKHVQSHICEYYDINEDGEDAAYLIGYIVQQMYNKFKDLL